MKDEILQSYLNDFSEKFNILDKNTDVQFEFFANYSIISKLYPSEIEDLEDISMGGGGDTGIDGLAIIVNGNLVKDAQEIDGLIKLNNEIDVQFVFIQSKTSAKFNGSNILTFISGVKNFFEHNSCLDENSKIKNARKIKDKIYKNAIKFFSGLLPEIKIYYITTGEWKSPNDISNKCAMEFKILNERRLFRNQVSIDFIDAERLKRNYNELNRKIKKQIYFPKYSFIPRMPEYLEVRQSVIGCLSVKEYLNLITDDSGNLLKELFYDNVRDYQGLNKINQEIQKTISDDKNKFLMPLLNNGITIITKKAEPVGDSIILSDFQIVNGCQSSHILYHQRHQNMDDIFIIVKIIETNNQDVINKIIVATNKQTEVKDEAFESIKPFHINLSDLFVVKSKKSSFKIYYERRSKEYFNQPEIRKNQIVTLSYLTKCYIASILQQPQSTHRYFGELISSNDIFKNEKNLTDYYNSCFILKKIEMFFDNGKLAYAFKVYKYHLLFLIFLRFNRKEIENIISQQDMLLEKYLIQACKIISCAKSKSRNNKNYLNIRSRHFTSLLKDIEANFEYRD